MVEKVRWRSSPWLPLPEGRVLDEEDVAMRAYGFAGVFGSMSKGQCPRRQREYERELYNDAHGWQWSVPVAKGTARQRRATRRRRLQRLRGLPAPVVA